MITSPFICINPIVTENPSNYFVKDHKINFNSKTMRSLTYHICCKIRTRLTEKNAIFFYLHQIESAWK